MYIFGQRKSTEVKIAQIIDAFLATDRYDCYLEPFCGGCGVTKKIKSTTHKICSDISEDLIVMWQAVINKWKPPTQVSLDAYLQEKNHMPSARRGFIGYCCSDDGQFFGEFDNDQRAIKSRAELLIQDGKKLVEVEFGVADFAVIRPKNLLVYCDPPMQGTVYEDQGFDYNKFWSWVRYFGKEDNTFLISAQTAPNDFQLLYEFDGSKNGIKEGVYKYGN